jgi:LysR family transcriptional regulator, benzoate and cis,cis-muconate-responsive activator of ben and cat genes
VELRHLRYFIAVADELNFTKAAQKMRVAQPALSRQIRQLEEEMGVTLLDRNQRSVRLTEAGKAFLVEARSLVTHSEQVIKAAQSIRQGDHVTLNIGYVWGLFHSLVPGVIEKFRRSFPEVAINLFDTTATQQAQMLSENRLDAGFIGFAEEADTAGLKKQKVGTCRFVAALPKNHRAARHRVVDLTSLAQEMFFVISADNYPGAARFVSEACRAAGFRPKIIQTVERGHILLGLVAGNCGVALVPEPLRALPHPGVVFRPLVKPPQGDLYLAWNGRHSMAVRDSFVKELASV